MASLAQARILSSEPHERVHGTGMDCVGDKGDEQLGDRRMTDPSEPVQARRPVSRRSTAWASLAGGLVALGIGVACTVTDSVTGPAARLHTIVVSPISATIAAGGSKSFTATGQDASGHPISGLTFFWSSSNTLIVTVAQSGQVIAVNTGQAQIAASAAGVSGFATVTSRLSPSDRSRSYPRARRFASGRPCSWATR